MNVRRRLLALIGALAFSVSLLAVFVSGEGVAGQELDLFFSEYIEGTGNNKALEIYNPTDTEIVLQESNYRVYFYFNGNSTIGENIQLTGKVPAKGVFVLYHSGIFNQGTGNAGLQQAINSIDDSNNKQANSSSWYNGDDAIELVKNGVPIDRFGKIGEDPGTHWTGSAGGATVQTSDRTLVRKPNIFSGFTDNIENFDPSLEWKEYPTNTSTYLGWHSVEYTVTFQPGLHGTLGSGEAAQSVAHGEDAVPPQVIPNEGYLHGGWSQSYQNVTSDLTITALYTLKTYTVAFDLDGKGFHESGSLLQTVDHGKDASPPAVKPLEGHLLFGWDQRYSNVKENREIKALYQTWTSPGVFFSEYVEGSGNNKALEIYNGTGDVIDLAAGHYQVHIDFNGGTSLPTISLHGVIEPGGVFVLVHSGANEALKAKANQITSHNMFNGNDVVLLLKDGVVIDCFGKPGEELDAGVDDSEKIKGWMGGGVQTGNRTLVRKPWVGEGVTGIPSQLEDPVFFFDPSLQWIAYRQDNFDYLGFHDNQSIHTVTFVQGTGGTLEGQLKQTVYSGQSASAPTPQAAEGHQFNGWQGSYTNVRADETVGALWKAISYTISFDSAGGSGISSIRQDYGTPIKTLPLPVRAGHTFLGWDQPVPETMPASDLILTARWAVNQYTLTFDSRGGSPVAAMVLDFGSAIVAPLAPEHELYEFAGWKPELPTNMPEGDLTVRAQWRFKGMLLPDEDVLVPVTGAVPPLVPPLVLTGLSMVFLILAQMIRRKKKATGRT